jgi:hypothetical protein
MKTWNSPEILSLNVNFTNAGNYGGQSDGAEYDIEGFGRLLGTSGPSIENNPGVTPVN